jgi:CBS domain containing-hemolysin-like protein
VNLLWLVPVLVLLLLLKGFFSGSEIALVNADKMKLSHRARQGHRGAAMVLELFKTPEKLLTTTLVGTNIATVTMATLGTLLAIQLLGERLGDLWAALILTPLMLVLGEIVPKSVYQQRSEAMAPVVVYPLRLCYWLFLPVVFVFSRIARLAARLVGGRSQAPHLFATRQQLRGIMEVADRAKGIRGFDRRLVERAIRFPDATVGDAMIPVAELVTIACEAETASAIKLARQHGLTRLPAFQESVSNIQGILTLSPWDLLDPQLPSRLLAELVKPAQFVSPHERLEDLLPILRERADQCAVVVDEYGSAVGLITVQQIVETVVGDVEVGWEFEGRVLRPPRYTELEDGGYRVDGRLPIPDLNDLLGLDLPSGEFHTVAGLVTWTLRHVPAVGESFVRDGQRFTVEEVSPRAVRSVRVEPG